MKTSLTLAFAILGCVSLFAQWEPTNGPFGGFIYDLKKNDNYMFASTENGLYRSPDGGNTWSHLNISPEPGSTSSIDINGSELVAIAYGQFGNYVPKLYKTEDNGGTWYDVNIPDSVGSAQVAITDYAMYVMGSHYLLISTDNGQSWQNSNLNTLAPYPDAITTFNQ